MPRFVVADLHRNVSLLVIVFIVIHVATSVIDSFAPIRWLDAIIPFGSRYRPVWLGLGALAFDVLIAVAVTSLVRARMGYRVWRAHPSGDRSASHPSVCSCWSHRLEHPAVDEDGRARRVPDFSEQRNT